MTLADKMRRDALAITKPGHHRGETMLYRFAAGGTRNVQGTVTRLDRVEADEGDLVHRAALVRIPRDGTAGVTAIADGDRIDVPLRIGEAATTCRIMRIDSENEGSFLVEVRA